MPQDTKTFVNQKGQQAGHSWQVYLEVDRTTYTKSFCSFTPITPVRLQPHEFSERTSEFYFLSSIIQPLKWLMLPWMFPSVALSALHWLFSDVTFRSFIHTKLHSNGFWLVSVQLSHPYWSWYSRFDSSIALITLMIFEGPGDIRYRLAAKLCKWFFNNVGSVLLEVDRQKALDFRPGNGTFFSHHR